MTEINMPPSSQEAEDAILGAIIETPSLLDETTAYLSSDIFYYERSKRLYFILTEMHKNGEQLNQNFEIFLLTKVFIAQHHAYAKFMTIARVHDLSSVPIRKNLRFGF